ncbi:hypothetical protein [Marinobacter sp. V034]|uniref:hypothetical protein n=1 Tax=Marinobacter sp. V034 TaxID=3459610 RepID=UPI004043FD44
MVRLASIARFYLMLATLTPALAAADTTSEQSFETCSMITSEYVTVLQLVAKGFSKSQLTESLPGLSPAAEKRVTTLFDAATASKSALVDTFSAVNAEYAKCSKRVYDRSGRPPPASRESHFYFCAGENKLRYEVLISATLDAPISKVLPQLPATREPIARAIYDLYHSDGVTAAFDAIGDELKYCLNGQG